MFISGFHFNNSVNRIIFLCCSLVVLSSCGLSQIKKQTEAAENTGIFKGKVNVTSGQKGNVLVVLIRNAGRNTLSVERHVQVDEHGKYIIYAVPSTYLLGTFVDKDNNGLYSKGEHARMYGDLKPLTLAKGQVVTVNMNITGEPKWKVPSDTQVLRRESLSMKNIGRVVSLDNPMFEPEAGPLGLWRPIDYLQKYGAGLFMLQKYKKNRIPVIFVHGANGASGDWRHMISTLDKKHFQPWVFNYPSGVRLDLASNYLKLAVSELQRKYKMKQIYLVSHSMGGLVTRSFIMKYRESFPVSAKNIRLVMTINSPMMGIASAGIGVKYSPIMVPSWRDVASGSAFIQKIHAWSWPKELPYHLVFSYQHGEGDDGVVDLESQIPLKLQDEATRIHGFNNSHAGILHDKVFINKFQKILRTSLH